MMLSRLRRAFGYDRTVAVRRTTFLLMLQRLKEEELTEAGLRLWRLLSAPFSIVGVPDNIAEKLLGAPEIR